MIVVSLLSVHVVCEDRNHVLVGVGIQVVDLVALVENVGHHVWRGRVDNGRRDNVGHIPRILVLWNLQLLVGIELTNSTKVHITSENGDADRLGLCDVLQLLDKPVAFLLVVLGCPVVIEIIKNLDTAVELVYKATEQTSSAHSLDRIHHSAGKNVLKEVQPWVGYGYAQKNDKVFGLAFDNLIFEPIENDVV